MEDLAPKCLAVALRGERDRSSGGVVYADEERIGYAFLHELNLPPGFRDELHKDMLDDEDRHYFVIHNVSSQLHVFKMKRQ